MAWKCPIWHFYAADRGASPAALHRVRRQDSVAIRARHDDARDPGTSGRDLWRGSVRSGTFTPQIVAPHQRRFTGFDDKILSLYARGMTTREIQGHLEEIYGVEVSDLALLRRRSWRLTSGASPGSTTRFCRYTREA